MSTTVNWPALNPTTYSVPAAGEVNWPSLSNLLITLGTNAQSTAAQKIAIRVAVSTPVTVVQTTDCVVVTDLTVAGAVAVQLPAGVAGQVLMLADGKGDASTNNVTITAFAGETINGASTLVLNKNRAAVILVFSTTSLRWTTVAEFTNIAAGTIPRSSVAAGTANYVIINSGAGLLSQEQFLAKTRGGTGADNSAVTYPTTGVLVTEAGTQTLTNKSIDSATNTLSNVDLPSLKTVLADADKVIRRDVTGAVISGNAVPNSSAIVTTDSTQTLTGKTIDGDDNTVQDVSLASLKTVLASANKVIRRDAAGVVVADNTLPNSSAIVTIDAAQVITLKDIDGGTASNTSRLTLPRDTFANISALTRKKGTILYATDLDTVFYDDGTSLLAVGSGSGAGELNAITNPSAATATTGVTVTGTSTVTRLASAGPLSPLIVTAFRFAAGAATNSQRINFTVPTALLNTKLKWEFFIAPESGYVSGDHKLELWDQAGVTQYPLSTDSSAVSAIANYTGKYTTTFNTASTTTLQLRFVRVLGTKYIDVTNIIVGPGIQPQGAAVGPTISFTPTFSNSTGVSAQFSQYSRIGNKMHLHMRFDFFATGAGGQFTVTVPDSLTIDGSIFPTSNTEVGYGNIAGSLAYSTAVRCLTSTTIYFIRTTATSFSYSGTDFVAGNIVSFQAIIPIAEWAGSGTVNLAQNDVEYSFNSSLTDANDSTSFGYGSGGGQFGAFTLGRSKNVRFRTPILNSDEITLEMTGDGGFTWVAAGQQAVLVDGHSRQNGTTYGAGVSPINSTDVEITFGQYRTATGATYGGAGNTWAGISANNLYKYRVKKIASGQAVGFGNVAQNSSGLVKSAGQLQGTNTSDTALAGFVGEETFTDGSSAGISGANGGYLQLTTLALTGGDYLIHATFYLSGFANQSNVRIGVTIDAVGVYAVSQAKSYTGESSLFPCFVGGAAADFSFHTKPRRVTVSAGATVTYRFLVEAGGGAGSISGSGRLSARRIR